MAAAFNVGLHNSIETKVGELFSGGNGAGSDLLSSNAADNSSIYTDGELKASVRKANNGETAEGVLGTDSLFNPFRIFRYSAFGNPDGKGYKVDKHKFSYVKNAGNSDEVEPAKMRTVVSNPTASAIVEWANEKAAIKTGPLYPYPYQINDFLWCRHYGKIPNNRMLTLRRYPIPVEDNLAVHIDKLPLVPIAQAVTWWGGDSGNKLSSVFGMTYGLNWGQDLTTKVQDVVGNELGIGAAYEALGIKDKTVQNALTLAYASTLDGQNAGIIIAEADKKLQDWEKAAYGPEGAYWNRILGPVNIINSTKNRGVGYNFEHNISLDFEYNLRSYGRINPKVAMLDLISNFLSLTYNTADFYGGGIRYFKKTGVLIPPFNTENMEKGNFIGALADISAAVGAQVKQTSENLTKFLDKAGLKLTDVTGGGAEAMEKLNALGNSNAANVLVASRMKAMYQNPLQMRSMLDGRAVGEWHLMVGNPMNPLAVIGNLCLTGTTMTFSEELGEEDFPISVKFTVNLEPGRPRAKQDIESMFNMGGGDMTFTTLAEPTSSYSSQGDYASMKSASSNQSISQDEKNSAETSAANNLASYFKGNIARSYGENFAKSQILTDYFKNYVTRD